MKSKEEILKEEMGIWSVKLPADYTKTILNAMQTYAEQQSVEFAEWIILKGYHHGAYDGYKENHEYWHWQGNIYTTSQLFKIWKDETGK